MEEYDPQKIEKKWQSFWEKNKTNFCDLTEEKKNKFYNLVMFFYPSGAKIHIGHIYNYTGADVYGRYKRLNGFNVFQPMGYDAFGLPAENYAIKTGVHPKKTTKENIEFGKKQLKSAGLMFDWSKEINTSSPDYYKWTQWLFGVLYKKGLAYRKESPVNWCPSCKTVLANEQVKEGKCERCESKVVQKNLKQWFFKITAYADKLLEGYEKINWPERTILMQKNWIGKSRGAEIEFPIKENREIIKVFTTRPDTLFGATFLVLSPEHSLVAKLQENCLNKEEIEKYIEKARGKTEMERTEQSKEKTGVKMEGIFAVNPASGEEIPVFVADYILFSYGSGAIMAVPAHDSRDWDFAKKYGLKIIPVIEGGDMERGAFEETENGKMINSEKFNGLEPKDGGEKIVSFLQEKGAGDFAVNYKLRDWLISRQRYWGAPIPIVYCDRCGEVLIPKNDLPVELPEMDDFTPKEDGQSPLAKSGKFINAACPKCGGKAKRSSETMDTFVCSSWYYLRFINPGLKEEPFKKELAKKWLPVNQYCGGAEHACTHLLYARFITKVLYDEGLINFNEPFSKLNHQGMILAEDGTKMSKSKGNVVIPDDYIKMYGADIFRAYVLFLAPFEQGGRWDAQGIVGVDRFLKKVWKLQGKVKENAQPSDELKILFHQTVKKTGDDIKNFKFNTAISALMILAGEFEKQKEIPKNLFKDFIIILSPFAPHLAEEMWQRVGEEPSVFDYNWPTFDPSAIETEELNIVVQVNGKVRDKIKVKRGTDEEEIKKIALNSEKIQKWLEGKEPQKIIMVKNKLVNIVL